MSINNINTIKIDNCFAHNVPLLDFQLDDSPFFYSQLYSFVARAKEVFRCINFVTESYKEVCECSKKLINAWEQVIKGLASVSALLKIDEYFTSFSQIIDMVTEHYRNMQQYLEVRSDQMEELTLKALKKVSVETQTIQGLEASVKHTRESYFSSLDRYSNIPLHDKGLKDLGDAAMHSRQTYYFLIVKFLMKLRESYSNGLIDFEKIFSQDVLIHFGYLTNTAKTFKSSETYIATIMDDIKKAHKYCQKQVESDRKFEFILNKEIMQKCEEDIENIRSYASTHQNYKLNSLNKIELSPKTASSFVQYCESSRDDLDASLSKRKDNTEVFQRSNSLNPNSRRQFLSKNNSENNDSINSCHGFEFKLDTKKSHSTSNIVANLIDRTPENTKNKPILNKTNKSFNDNYNINNTTSSGRNRGNTVFISNKSKTFDEVSVKPKKKLEPTFSNPTYCSASLPRKANKGINFGTRIKNINKRVSNIFRRESSEAKSMNTSLSSQFEKLPSQEDCVEIADRHNSVFIYGNSPVKSANSLILQPIIDDSVTTSASIDTRTDSTTKTESSVPNLGTLVYSEISDFENDNKLKVTLPHDVTFNAYLLKEDAQFVNTEDYTSRLNPLHSFLKTGYLRQKPNTGFGIRAPKWPIIYCLIEKEEGWLRGGEIGDATLSQLQNLMLSTVKVADDVDRNLCFRVLSPDTEITLQAFTPRELKQWIAALNEGIEYSLHNHKEIASRKTSKKRHANRISFIVNEEKPLKQEDATVRILAVEGNNICADCGINDPKWASSNLGLVICIECSGAHRSLGVHISKVRSIALDTWSETLVIFMENKGNSLINAQLESNINPAEKPSPSSSRKEKNLFITNKYVLLKYS